MKSQTLQALEDAQQAVNRVFDQLRQLASARKPDYLKLSLEVQTLENYIQPLIRQLQRYE